MSPKFKRPPLLYSLSLMRILSAQPRSVAAAVARANGIVLLALLGWFVPFFPGQLAADSVSTTHPIVASFERLFTDTPEAHVEFGDLLLTELGCVNCHDPGPAWSPRFPHRQGPVMTGLDARVHDAFLAPWLANPQQMKPGSLMPNLFAGLNEDDVSARTDAIAHFLLSLEDPHADAADLPGGFPSSGRVLYHSLGCVACHEPGIGVGSNQAQTDLALRDFKHDSVPLGDLPNKYSAKSLARFLLDPLAVRPAGRMPHLELTKQEAADIAVYLVGSSSDSTAEIELDATKVTLGRDLFFQTGCSACHDTGMAAIRTKALAPALSEIARDRDGGCLADRPKTGVPEYHLSVRQRSALQAALEHLLRPDSPAQPDSVRRHLLQFNCYACHSRNDVGGPNRDRLRFFTTGGQDLGDEGRLPPHLSGVGRKLTRTALVDMIAGRMSVRPYMTTRMPGFGKDAALLIAEKLTVEDHDTLEKPTPKDSNAFQVGRNMWGRALMGTKGLGCIVCHDLNGRSALGIRAMDLSHMTDRLRPEWFRDYLLNPTKFRPGTRMPAFWPEGQPSLKGFGGSTLRQIDSLWVYLSELDQSRPPEGLEAQGTFELKPKDGPIVFRTFMKHAGLHAIAVGFPQGIHAAFDSQTVRWAVAWKGKFLDAASTWENRFTPLAEPLGDALFLWPEKPLLVASTPSVKTQFRGYRRAADGTPVMIYLFGNLEVEDRMAPAPAGDALVQTLILRGNPGEIDYQIRIPEAKTGEPQPTIDILYPPGRIATDRIPLRFDAVMEAKLVLKWSW